MTDVQERREAGTQRVPVSTLVEICGNVPGIPVFEAQSVDVSARGMHLRTAYLPDAGAPLVCRFENDGSEIVVEGLVAWRREGGRGGEFGVKFTALDSRCVEALKGLCGPEASSDPAAERDEDAVGEPGSRVRLHIEGLGSPMKARVKTGGSSKVQVGSNLEFLKVGRRLEIEDLEQGARRAAHIDGVSVLVDPSTRIPQLVVALRYEGSQDTTPSPSTADVSGAPDPGLRGLRIPAEAVTTDAREVETPKAAASAKAAADIENDGDEPEMRGRVATLAASAEQKAKVAGEKLAEASSSAARGAASLFRSAANSLRDFKQRHEKAPARRTTSVLPAASTEKPRLRPQNASGAAGDEQKPMARRWTRRNVAIAGGAGLVAATALALALRAPSSPPPGANAAAAASAVAVAEAPAAAAAGAAAAAVTPGGAVTANVPLFGPTPLTTTEPAPLGPPPSDGSIEAEELEDAKSVAKPAVADERWPEEDDEASAKPAKADKSEAATTKPEDVSPWGRGRVHEPTIHRLRLDGPGAALQGAIEPTGFTVVIPSRKVMEAASTIGKRDPRIARVRASNTDSGAQISFRFKDGVPAYRVRLRRDYVEFLISAPVKTAKAPKSSSTEPTKSKTARAAR